MKGKEFISAALGSAFFAVPYLALSTPLAPAIIIGVSAFGASELVFSSFKKKETLKDTNISLYEKISKSKKQNKHFMQEYIGEIKKHDVIMELSYSGIAKTKYYFVWRDWGSEKTGFRNS